MHGLLSMRSTNPVKGWQLWTGMGGSFAVESVAAFVWNGWQACGGIGGRFQPEYAFPSFATLWPKKERRRVALLEVRECLYKQFAQS